MKNKLPVVTLESVKAAVGRTWFSISDDGDCIALDTRDHGDVGGEEAGAADIAEGKRLLPRIKQVFSPSMFLVAAEVIDEWVTIVVRKLPLTREEKLLKAQKMVRAKINAKVKKISDVVKGLGHSPAFITFDSGYQAEGHRYRPAKLHVIVPFGEAVASRYTSYRYMTADVAEAAARTVLSLITGFPMSEWQMEPTRPLYEFAAFDGRILYRSSEIRFTATLNIK